MNYEIGIDICVAITQFLFLLVTYIAVNLYYFLFQTHILHTQPHTQTIKHTHAHKAINK